ncbi:MAG: HD domain-containing protein [Promethearchaeota archaeon]
MNDRLELKLAEIIRKESDEAALIEWRNAQLESSKPLYNYRYDHVKEVVKLTKYLAKRCGADIEVTTLAAWLHDLSKPGIRGISNHGEASAMAARNLLADEGIESEIIERVCDTIEKHVGLTLEDPVQPLEAQVLWDADKIVKLGAMGLIHFMINGIKINPGFLLDEISAAINEFLKLADRIVESMNTEPGKELAKRRFAALKHFAKDLETELEMADAAI